MVVYFYSCGFLASVCSIQGASLSTDITHILLLVKSIQQPIRGDSMDLDHPIVVYMALCIITATIISLVGIALAPIVGEYNSIVGIIGSTALFLGVITIIMSGATYPNSSDSRQALAIIGATVGMLVYAMGPMILLYLIPTQDWLAILLLTLTGGPVILVVGYTRVEVVSIRRLGFRLRSSQRMRTPAQNTDSTGHSSQELLEYYEPQLPRSFTRGRSSSHKHRTDGGELVRSKSEVIVANILSRLGLEYHYEEPLHNPQNRSDTIKPDFTIYWKGKTFYWEHLGMLHVPQYRESWEWKRNWYDRCGFSDRLIISRDGPDGSIDTQVIEDIARKRILSE